MFVRENFEGGGEGENGASILEAWTGLIAGTCIANLYHFILCVVQM